LRDLLNVAGPAPSSSWIASGDTDDDKARAIARDLREQVEKGLTEELRKATDEARKAEEQD
jgi:hypothetical protein